MADFPTDQDIKRIKQLENYRTLFDGLHEKVFNIYDLFQKDLAKKETLYIVVNLPSLISEYYADMIIGDGVLFDVEDENTQKEINDIANSNDLDVKLFESAVAQSEYGFVPIRMRIEDKQPIIEQVPSTQYFPIYSNDITPVLQGVILAAYVEIGEGNDKKIYLYKEVYTKENEKIYLEYQLWTVNEEAKEDKQISLSLFDEDLPEGKQLTEFKEFPVWQINNIKTSDDLFGRSDYMNIMPQMKGINEMLTQINIELRKNLNSRIAVPQGTLDKSGKIAVSEADIFEVGEGEKMPQYIQKSNPLIEEAFNTINFHLRIISAITKIPVEALGIEGKGGVEKVEAMRLRLFNTEKKVQRKRVYYEKTLQDIMTTALEIIGKKDVDISIVWSEILPISEFEQTNILAEQVAGGLKSKRKAIKELQRLDDELLEKELEDIAEGNRVELDSITEPQRPQATFEDINNI